MTGLDTAMRSAGIASKLSKLSKLSKALGISKMSVSLWKKNGIPVDRVMPFTEQPALRPTNYAPISIPTPLTDYRQKINKAERIITNEQHNNTQQNGGQTH